MHNMCYFILKPNKKYTTQKFVSELLHNSKYTANFYGDSSSHEVSCNVALWAGLSPQTFNVAIYTSKC